MEYRRRLRLHGALRLPIRGCERGHTECVGGKELGQCHARTASVRHSAPEEEHRASGERHESNLREV